MTAGSGATPDEQGWRELALPELPTPIYALAPAPGRLWAGGLGGVACYRSAVSALGERVEEWEPGPVLLPPAPVTVLWAYGNLVLAGGNGGLAYSLTGGAGWQRAEIEDGSVGVTVLAPSPRFGSDNTLLAGTLANGVLRSTDGGRSWRNVSFGLQSQEITDLLWLDGSTALLATDEGLYRSRDGGRGWRRVLESSEGAVEALTRLPDGGVLAVLENGALLQAEAGTEGERWQPLKDPDGLEGVQPLSLFTTERGTLLLGTQRGLLRSADGGRGWQTVDGRLVHVLRQGQGRLYAGCAEGVLLSEDDGQSWRPLPTPPLHDLLRLQPQGERLWLLGTHTAPLQLELTPRDEAPTWQRLQGLTLPLTGCAAVDDETLLLAGPEGLLRLWPRSGEHQLLLAEPLEGNTLITWAGDGPARQIWVASGSGQRLWHSANDGASWHQLAPPFGVTPLVALQATREHLVAATYDPRQYHVCLWYSTDDGSTWVRGLEADTNWPLVASCAEPLALGVGNILLVAQPDGTWRRSPVGHGGGGIRRVVSCLHEGLRLLFVLAGGGIFRSHDLGQSWQAQHEGLPLVRIADIACTSTRLWALLSGGVICQRRL
ncbi:WD40/YVTN/BNR-like repeat-containing protein [Thermogemmatispora sp.]|uniref:WD40/YVTN/BNR-like repeat-containing protein n=1 Tax=Thermogemmatispora sp. TaxID=1968838 RepID=UPI0035E42DFB